MNWILKYLIVLLTVTIFYSCKTSENEHKLKRSAKGYFPKEINIHFTNDFKIKGALIRQIFPYNGNLIFHDLNVTKNYFFHQYSLKEKKIIGSYIKKGTKKGEALGGFMSGIYNNNIIWFHDLTLSRLVTTKISSYSLKYDTTKVNQFKLPRHYYSIQMFDSITLFGFGSNHTKEKIQMLKLNSLNNETNLFGKFESFPKNIPYYASKKAYEGLLYLKPNNEKLVVAYIYTDKVEIFDLKNNKTILVYGPENFEPDFTPIMKYGLQDIILGEKTKFGFVNGCTTDKYIYLLYSGKSIFGKNADQSNSIYVYDWSGNPIKKMQFKENISSFTILNNDSEIYVFDPQTQFLLSAKMPQ